jgi:hypothetical protein
MLGDEYFITETLPRVFIHDIDHAYIMQVYHKPNEVDGLANQLREATMIATFRNVRKSFVRDDMEFLYMTQPNEFEEQGHMQSVAESRLQEDEEPLRQTNKPSAPEVINLIMMDANDDFSDAFYTVTAAVTES